MAFRENLLVLANCPYSPSFVNLHLNLTQHLDEVELIHMNGRLYDYNVGRFLSVDPFIHAPSNSQSINPYSYIMNNPLAGTDPSGYSSHCDTFVVCTLDEQWQDQKRVQNGGKTGVQGVLDNNGATRNDGNSKNSPDPSKIGGQTESANNKTSESSDEFKYSLKEQQRLQIKEDAANLHINNGGLDAKWGNVQRDENGVITKAVITCDQNCQKQGADRRLGRDLANSDLTFTLMRMNMRSAQTQAAVATGIATASPYVLAQPFIFYGGLSSTQKMIAFMSFDLAITQAGYFESFKNHRGFDWKSLGQTTIIEARSLKGRMRIRARIDYKKKNEN